MGAGGKTCSLYASTVRAVTGGATPGAPPPFGPAMAAATLVSIPVILVFLALQRHYIAGLTLGGVKQ